LSTLQEDVILRLRGGRRRGRRRRKVDRSLETHLFWQEEGRRGKRIRKGKRSIKFHRTSTEDTNV
jgi:hypothetical protein